MKALIMINMKEGQHAYVQIPVKPALIHTIDYPYFIVHNVVKEDGVFDFAYTVSDYQTGMRVLPSSVFAYSEEQAIEMTVARLSKYDTEYVQNIIKIHLELFGRANQIKPYEWPN